MSNFPSDFPRTDKWVDRYGIDRNSAIHAFPMTMEEELKTKDAVISDMGKRFDKLGAELSAMTAERDAARDMLCLKELCDMPADYAAMVQRLEEERDALLSECGELRATLADYKAQLCKPDDCERVKRLECELAKVREELRRACAYMRSTHHKFVDDQNEVKRIEEVKP